MRYTRYNYNKGRGGKRNNKGGFFASVIIIVALAIVLGIFVGKIIFKDGIVPINTPNDIIQNDKKNPNDETETSAPLVESLELYYLQCGVFSTKENSENLIKTLPGSYKGFTIEEEGKFRAIVGLFNKDEIDAKSQELNSAGISNMKIKSIILAKESNDNIKIQILDGYMKILAKLNEKDVKSYKTEDFKTWIVDNEGRMVLLINLIRSILLP